MKQPPLFAPFRALGYITEDVPFVVQRRGKEAFVTVSVGKCWQVYNCETLRLVLVGPQLSHTIRALAVKNDLTWAALGSLVIESRRIARIGTYATPAGSGAVVQMLALGEQLLVLYAGGLLAVWHVGVYDKPEHELRMPEGWEPRCMCHPDTYLNKIVIGGADGRLLLFNIVSGALLYTFEGVNDSPVCCIEGSPALDVVGIGFGDGHAVLHNLRTDKKVLDFANASGVGLAVEAGLVNDRSAAPVSGGACTAITFRSGVGVPLMAAGGGAGVITVWDLEGRRLSTVIRGAHDAPLTSLHFMPGEPRLMSAGRDNALRQWLFDNSDGSARLLRFRSGHSAPPGCLAYYGDGSRLLSAGHDRALRLFSVIQDQQSRELSQRHTAKRAKRLHIREEEAKLPRVTAIAACQVRERDWCNIISAHSGEPAAYTWLLKNYALGEHELRPPKTKKGIRGDGTPVSTVTISSCGNFGIVGTAGGRIDRYNMQSGIHRGCYARQPEKAATGFPSTRDPNQLIPAHLGTVTGLSVGSTNRTLISTSLDATLRSWSFRNQKLTGELVVGSPVTYLARLPDSALAAVACDDLSVRVFDVEAMQQVRLFEGHQDRITDLVVSEDCRWLLSSSMDGTIRVWDIPASATLQVMRLGSPVTALSLSPRMDLLATAHVGQRGVFLWSNQRMFGAGGEVMPSTVPVDIRLPAIGRDAVEVNGPVPPRHNVDGFSSDEGTDDESSEDDSLSNSQAAEAPEQHASDSEAEGQAYLDAGADGAPLPLAPQLATLSALPRTQWHNLIHLDAIRDRSRPLQPPSKPEAAPFFLPTVAGLAGRPIFDTEADQQPKSKVLSGPTSAGLQGSEFTRTLAACAKAGDFTSISSLLREMTPAAVDAELRSMELLEGCDPEEILQLGHLLAFLDDEVVRGTSYEFAQALLQATLQIHGEAIMQHDELRRQASRIEKHLRLSWSKVDRMVESVRCMLGLLSSTQL